MALQASGSISASQISNEFGQTTNISFGAYRVSQTVGSLANLPLDTGIPQSGSISFSNFYSKRLNIVVDFYSGGTVTRQTARTRYNNSNVTVIGGFKTRPSSGAGSRVIINVNKNIGSAQGNINNVALRTGSWESNTNLEMEVGSSGQLFGAGGNGGGAGGASGLPVLIPVFTAGGGGGGGGDNNANGGTGGSGIVIIKVPDTVVGTFSGATVSTATPAGFNIYTVTAATAATVTFNPV